MRRTDLKEALEDLVDSTGRVEDMLAVLAEIYQERARRPRYRVFENQMHATADVLHEASRDVASIFSKDEALERAAGRAAYQEAHEAGRRNPKPLGDLDYLIQGLPATAPALSAWLDRQQPRRSLESKVEAVLFHAIDGGVVDDLDAWTEAVTDGGTEEDLAPALRRLMRRRR